MPETSSYYHLAYAIALGIYAAYALSLYVRRKRVRGGSQSPFAASGGNRG